MTRFDWHVLRRFLAAAFLLLALLCLTFVTLDYVERVDDFLDRGATMRQVFGTYYPYYLFDMVRLTSPLALFLAAIYVTARLAQSMQLQALHSAGVSLTRFMRPIVGVTVLLTVGLVAFNGFAVPRANRIVHAFQDQYYRDAPETLQTGQIYRQVAPGVLLATGFFDRDGGQAFRVSLVTIDTTGGRALTHRLDAPVMEWVDSLDVWRIQEAVLRDFDGRGSERFRRVTDLDTVLAVRPLDLAQSERDAQRLTIPEAARFVESLRRTGVKEIGRPVVDYQSKFAYPLANLILVLIGVPLAARRRRGGQAVQLALGLGVAFAYLALQKTVEPLGYVETIPPVVAAWAPHAAFAVVALLLLWRARR